MEKVTEEKIDKAHEIFKSAQKLVLEEIGIDTMLCYSMQSDWDNVQIWFFPTINGKNKEDGILLISIYDCVMKQMEEIEQVISNIVNGNENQ